MEKLNDALVDRRAPVRVNYRFARDCECVRVKECGVETEALLCKHCILCVLDTTVACSRPIRDDITSIANWFYLSYISAFVSPASR